MSTPDNPPAFPQQCADALDVGMVHEGMTLRDYFAAKALAGEAAAQGDSIQPPLWLAERAYKIADAMLAERAK